MNPETRKWHFVGAMAKHLPPSASQLKLLDINGQAGEILSQRRHDLEIRVISSDDVEKGSLVEDDLDAVVAYDISLETPFLNHVLQVMRAGGRLTIVLPTGDVKPDYVELLEKHGYVRILVEPAVDDLGVLIRGEKPHTTDDTLDRIQQVAIMDADLLDLNTFKGRYIHLLIQQLPNKPVWKLEPNEKVEWKAIAIEHEVNLVLGFSSLPKAVGFMQPAVVEGLIHDINKVGKFTKDTLAQWDNTRTIILNPTLDRIRGMPLTFIEIDPDTAEASDE